MTTLSDALRARLRARRGVLPGRARPYPPRRPAPAPRASRVGAVKDGVTFLLTVAAFVFGVYQFVYVNIYQEAIQPPALALGCDVADAGRRGPLEAVAVTVTLHNTSKTRVYVLAGGFNVYGARSAPVADPAEAGPGGYGKYQADALRDPGFRGGSVVSVPRYWDEDDTRVIDCGKFVGDGSWFEPDEAYATRFLVYVPAGRLDLVRVRLSAVMAKNDRAARARWQTATGGEVTAAVERETADPVHWPAFWRRDPPRWEPVGDDRGARQWMARNGVSLVESVSELSLWPPGGPDSPPAPPPARKRGPS